MWDLTQGISCDGNTKEGHFDQQRCDAERFKPSVRFSGKQWQTKGAAEHVTNCGREGHCDPELPASSVASSDQKCGSE
jgi:hypothetical protein